MKVLCLLLLSSSLFAVTVTPTTQSTISENTENFSPLIRFNTTGDGVAVWARTQVTQNGLLQVEPNRIEASLYTAATSSWEASPTFLDNGSAPIVGIDDLGNVTVIFIKNSQVQAIRYNATIATPAWETVATAITTANTNVYPAMDVNHNGIIAVVWISTETGSLLRSIQASAFDGTSWSTPIILNTPSNTDFVNFPQVAIDNTAITTGVNGQVIWMSASQTSSTSGLINTIPITITQ